jgi:hypothetical protein
MNVPHMFGVKEKCIALLSRFMEEQRQQNKRQEEQQPVGSTGHIVRRREIPLWGWLAVIAYMILVGNLMPSVYEGWALVAGWFAAGTICIANFSSCGRYHCKITGPGFYGLGVLAILETIGLVDAPGWVTFAALIAVLVVGFGLEYRYKGKEGTCYCNPS